jgi:hypothetical protein
MTRLFLLSTMAALLLSPVSAHHAFSPVYDEKQTVTVTGVSIQFRFVNPHALLYIDVTDDAGKAVKWTVEFAGRLSLSENGWTADSIKPGERVTVTGNPTHEAGTNRVAFRRLVKADGTQLLALAPQLESAIEQERRARARLRQQAK